MTTVTAGGFSLLIFFADTQGLKQVLTGEVELCHPGRLLQYGCEQVHTWAVIAENSYYAFGRGGQTVKVSPA